MFRSFVKISASCLFSGIILFVLSGCNPEARLAADASRGDVQSQYDLSEYYSELDIPQKTKAFQWMERAASSRYLPAMKKLAGFYLKGYGTKVDYPKAAMWFQRYYELKGDSEEALFNGRQIMLGASSRADVVAGFTLYRIAIMLENLEGDGELELARTAAEEMTIHTKKTVNWLLSSRNYMDAKKMVYFTGTCMKEYPSSFTKEMNESLEEIRKEIAKYIEL